MKLKSISKYGFITDETKNWNNYAKTFPPENKFKKEEIGMEIMFRCNNSGAVVEVYREKQEQPRQTTQKFHQSYKIKILSNHKLEEFEKEYNEFILDHKVNATQTHFNEGRIIGVLYYE